MIRTIIHLNLVILIQQHHQIVNQLIAKSIKAIQYNSYQDHHLGLRDKDMFYKLDQTIQIYHN